MGSKWVLGMIAIISVAAMAGVGFAAYTASASVTVNGTAGSFYLVQSAVVNTSSLTSVSAGCTYSGPGAAITVTAANLLPGDFCNFTVAITDPGSIGGNWGGYATACSGPCTQLTLTIGNTPPYQPPLLPLSGNTDHYFVSVHDVGSGQTAESDSWQILITGYPI